MKRATPIVLLLAAALAGCSASRSEPSAATAWNDQPPRTFHHRLGAGDALGLAMFGQEIQLAKAAQFGDSIYANVTEHELD